MKAFPYFLFLAAAMVTILFLAPRSIEGQVYIPHAGRIISPSTPTLEVTIAFSPTATITPTLTPRNTSTPSFTPSITPTPTNSPTITLTPPKTETPTTTPTVTPTATDTIGDGVIVLNSHYDYVDTEGRVTLLGEVRNDTDANATNIRIKVTLYTNRGEMIDSLITYTWLDVLKPKDKTCFEAVFLGNPIYHKYGFETLYDNTSQAPRPLQIVSDGTLYQEDKGTLYAFGQVRNTEPLTSTKGAVIYPQIIGTLYANEGHVVDCLYVSTLANELAPQASSIWNLTFRALPFATNSKYRVQPK